MTAEAVVVFRQDLAEQVAHRRKRAGHVSAKMRFLSAQLEAFFTNDLWLRNARVANLRARQLAQGLAACPGVRVVQPVEANLVFVAFPPALTTTLRAQGFEFLDWPSLGEGVVRLVCGFSTAEASVQGLIERRLRRSVLGLEALGQASRLSLKTSNLKPQAPSQRAPSVPYKWQEHFPLRGAAVGGRRSGAARPR